MNPLEIVIASGKGGVGKNTLSATLILHLHNKGYEVVAADTDSEAPNLHLLFGVNSWDSTEEYNDAHIAEIDYSKCDSCGKCIEACQFNAIKLLNGKYVIDSTIYEGCYTCSIVCPTKAISRRRKEER